MSTTSAFDVRNLLGRTTSTDCTWTRDDILRYALGVGAGPDELSLTTEHSEGHPLQVLPTFAVALTHDNEMELLGDVDRTTVVHAEQAAALEGPFPTAGAAQVVRRVEQVVDKGSGALVTWSTTVADTHSGASLARMSSTVFVRGAGGFGGERGAREAWDVPARAPDAVRTSVVADNQALLYRLSGDRNPLHSDPAFAARAGFPRPILHGLATYGITARLLVAGLCDGDASGLVRLDARFSAPVLPGETLVVLAWRDGADVVFRTHTGTGTVVLDRGRARMR